MWPLKPSGVARNSDYKGFSLNWASGAALSFHEATVELARAKYIKEEFPQKFLRRRP